MVNHVSEGAIGLMECVVSLDEVTIAMLVLRFDITSVRTFYFVAEFVIRINLWSDFYKYIYFYRFELYL